MKHAIYYSLLLLFAVGLGSCEKEDPIPDYDITGLWDLRLAVVNGDDIAKYYDELTIEFFRDNTFHFRGELFSTREGFGDFSIANSLKQINLTFDNNHFTFCNGLEYDFKFTINGPDQAIFHEMRWDGTCDLGNMLFQLNRK